MSTNIVLIASIIIIIIPFVEYMTGNMQDPRLPPCHCIKRAPASCDSQVCKSGKICLVDRDGVCVRR